MSKEVLGYEFKHSTYVHSKADNESDAVIIKERIHYKDGTTSSNLRIKENYMKPFYVLKENKRTFKQKRTWLRQEDCHEYTSNERMMSENIARILRCRSYGMQVMNRNPYLAGTDISSQVLIKHSYKTRYPDLVSYNNICHLDIETNMLSVDRDIIIVSVSMGDKVFQAVTRSFIKDIDNPIAAIHQLHQTEILPKVWERKIQPYWLEECKKRKLSTEDYSFEDYKTEFNGRYPYTYMDAKLNLEVMIVDSPAEAVVETFVRVHSWRPDILSIWNLPFDTKHMVEALKREGYDPADVFCDPSIPAHYRHFELREGRAKVEDANGVSESKDPWDRWHAVIAPSTFFWADQMSTRRFVRKHLPKEASYSLGDMLIKELGHGKLKGDNLTSSSGPNWHIEMQTKHKVFYCVYNQWDNVGAQFLDEKCLDLCFVFPNQCQYSELQSYGSQGRKLADDLYFFLKEKGWILTGVSDQMVAEFDKHSVPLEGWICTLSAHMIHKTIGKKILEESDGIFTKIIKFVLDIDVKSSYPSTGCWMNISRDTIRRVACVLFGIDFEEQRRAGLNLPSGRVNSLDIANKIFNFRSPTKYITKFKKEMQK